MSFVDRAFLILGAATAWTALSAVLVLAGVAGVLLTAIRLIRRHRP
ncbi:hypothetical protein [Streptomyces sp. NBC_00198]|nr:hypothetical protein [Streptomyces sp. NBC_00198]MCX5285957.1 hypothetical protein [Streptomyces sp. NBC_00198]MCX5286266.1 hypothetical protein [Streptomyces sp. NBC_00198]